MNRKMGLGLVTAATAGLCIGLVAHTGRAGGIPAPETLFYSGFLQEAGKPVEGERNFDVVVWDSMSKTTELCSTSATAVPVKGGRFRIALAEECTGVMRNNANTFVEVLVNDASLGVAKIGAVPYAVEAGNGVPPGTILAFAGQTAPPGWLPCDGTSYPRTQYPDLFQVVGTQWGAADGTSFNVPDLRGKFLRGMAPSGGADPDCATRAPAGPDAQGGCDKPGTDQAQQLGAHTHDVYGVNINGFSSGSGSQFYGFGVAPANHVTSNAAVQTSESRPLNAAVNYIVKY